MSAPAVVDTDTDTDSEGLVTADPASPRRQRRWGRGPAAARPPLAHERLISGVAIALTILGLVTATVLLETLAFGALSKSRAQDIARDDFRRSLANATAPVGQVGIDGLFLPLGAPVALLQIPAIGVDDVLLEGTTSSVLSRGPGHRRDSVLPGQPGVSLIFGRRLTYGGPFARIADLRPGDEITATTGQQVEPFTYVVEGVRRPGDLFPPPLEPGGSRLTLATAGGPWWAPDQPLFVDALLRGPAAAPVARPITAAALSDSEQLLQGDRGALLPLLLWAQGLLLLVLAYVYLRSRWGRWQVWVAGGPVLLVVGLSVAHQAARLLPNLI